MVQIMKLSPTSSQKIKSSINIKRLFLLINHNSDDLNKFYLS